MSKVRYYFELNPNIVDRFGGYQHITAIAETPPDGYLPRFSSYGPNNTHQLIAHSDRVIACDDRGPRYVKHRWADHQLAVVDPDEFFEIKMRSVEFG